MAQGKQGRATYNTLVARKLLDRWVPELMREEEPPPPPEEPLTAAAGCFRKVEKILNGGESKRAADWRNQLHINGKVAR